MKRFKNAVRATYEWIDGKWVEVSVGGGALVTAGAASATSIVDYASLGTAVSGELTAGIAAAVATVGIIWGARIGLRFIKGMFK